MIIVYFPARLSSIFTYNQFDNLKFPVPEPVRFLQFDAVHRNNR
jgi:hypothetical protein